MIMRMLATLTAAAILATSAAQAFTITDNAAFLGLWGGDIYAESSAPVSADVAVTAAYVTGGLGFSPLVALELENGADRFLMLESDNWSLDAGNVLSFLFDLGVGSSYGDWLKLTFTLDDVISDPFGLDTFFDTSSAQMVITTGTDMPAPVPVPAALPLLLGALGAVAAVGRRRKA